MRRVSAFLLLTTIALLPVQIAAQTTAAAPKAAPAAKPAAAPAGRLIEINGTAEMKFSLATITAKPGEKLTVRLKNTSAMPKMAGGHNFVLLKDTAKPDAFTTDAVMAGLPANYIPAARKAEVIASSPIIGPNETADVTFTVPTKPGTYVYLCTFPGHYAAGMKGTLIVK